MKLLLTLIVLLSTGFGINAQSSKPPSSSSSSKPKFGPAPVERPKEVKPKFGPSSSDKVPGSKDSRKPGSMGDGDKARANKEAESKRIYVEQKKATAPPKTEYKTADGKSIKIDPKSKTVETIRNKPSTYYQPEVRESRTVEHIHHYHYVHDTNWYCSQPTFYVGGGYSSAFWWMMMEWDAERRARWFYNNRHTIEVDAYNRGVHDAQVATYIHKWEAQKIALKSDYVDAEFADDPSLMYTQDHIEAIYNPEIATTGYVLVWISCVFFALVLVVLVIYMMNVRFGK